MLLEKHRQEILQKRPILLKNLIENHGNSTNPASFRSTFQLYCSQKQNLQIGTQVRIHHVDMDEPESLGGDNSAPNPVELLLSAFAGCMEMNWIMYSSISNLDIQQVDVEIIAAIDKRYVFGPKYGIPARLSSITIISHLYTNEPQNKVERVFEKVRDICPVGGSLHPDIEKKYELIFHSIDTNTHRDVITEL
jgi:uncharacterized OsmC-like protein